MSNTDISLLEKLRASGVTSYRPIQASLELTNRCNERCTHCYIPEYKDDEKRLLTLEQWKIVLQELREAGVLYLILMGGEAMLSPHFWGIAEEASRLGFSLSMITNGLLIKEETGKRLAEVGFSDITFSFYSLNPAVHDKMTKVYGSCARTQKAIEICLQNNIRVSVNCLLTEANINDYFELKEWCEARGLWLRFDPIITPKHGGDLTPTKYRARPEQIREFYKKLIQPTSVKKSALEFGDMSETHVCNAGKGKCAVTAYGELLTCIDIRESLGNLSQQKFSTLWEGHIAQKWRNIRNKDIKFKDKESMSQCEHCPGMAFHESGDALKVTEYETIVARAKFEAIALAHAQLGGEKHEKRKQRQKETEKEISIS